MRPGVVALAVLAPLAACTSVVTAPASLDRSRWLVTAVNGQPTPRTDHYRVEFRQGRLGGRLGCNSFSGDFRVAAEMLSVGPVAATRMACEEPHMSFEERGFAILQQPMRIGWRSGERLTLQNERGALDLERAP